MDVEYHFPGSMTVKLDEEDMHDLSHYGVCTERDGFGSIETKTWLRVADKSEQDGPRASIDGDGDLNISAKLHVFDSVGGSLTIEQGEIEPGKAAPDDIVKHYLGERGIISITWPE